MLILVGKTSRRMLVSALRCNRISISLKRHWLYTEKAITFLHEKVIALYIVVYLVSENLMLRPKSWVVVG